MLNEKYRFSLLILAAGQSQRFAPGHKLITPFKGKPLIRHLIDECRTINFHERIIILGHAAETLRPVLPETDLILIENKNFQLGMSTSIVTGVTALSSTCDAVFICPADMPFIQAAHFNALATAFDPENGKHICIPVYKGQQGHPVLFSKQYFSALKNLHGDQGARSILKTAETKTAQVEVPTNTIHIDLDTKQDFEKNESRTL